MARRSRTATVTLVTGGLILLLLVAILARRLLLPPFHPNYKNYGTEHLQVNILQPPPPPPPSNAAP